MDESLRLEYALSGIAILAKQRDGRSEDHAPGAMESYGMDLEPAPANLYNPLPQRTKRERRRPFSHNRPPRHLEELRSQYTARLQTHICSRKQ